MKGKASIAVPSTTSIIIIPTILGYFYWFVRISVTLAQTDPPIECPMRITFFVGCLCIIFFNISIVSLTKVPIEKSSRLVVFFECPCPLKSNAIKVPKCLTYLANKAKLCAECPAPWMQKKMAPWSPAEKTEVP